MVHTNRRAISKIHHPDFINTEKEMRAQKHLRKKWVPPRASAEKFSGGGNGKNKTEK